MISSFVIQCLENIISILTIDEILILYVVSIAKETIFSLPLSETRKAGILGSWPKYSYFSYMDQSISARVIRCDNYKLFHDDNVFAQLCRDA